MRIAYVRHAVWHQKSLGKQGGALQQTSFGSSDVLILTTKTSEQSKTSTEVREQTFGMERRNSDSVPKQVSDKGVRALPCFSIDIMKKFSTNQNNEYWSMFKRLQQHLKSITNDQRGFKINN